MAVEIVKLMPEYGCVTCQLTLSFVASFVVVVVVVGVCLMSSTFFTDDAKVCVCVCVCVYVIDICPSARTKKKGRREEKRKSG